MDQDHLVIVMSFFSCRSLSCQRITLHKNLFFSFVLNSVITIIWLTAVANNQEVVQKNPVSFWYLMCHNLVLMLGAVGAGLRRRKHNRAEKSQCIINKCKDTTKDAHM